MNKEEFLQKHLHASSKIDSDAFLLKNCRKAVKDKCMALCSNGFGINPAASLTAMLFGGVVGERYEMNITYQAANEFVASGYVLIGVDTMIHGPSNLIFVNLKTKTIFQVQNLEDEYISNAKILFSYGASYMAEIDKFIDCVEKCPYLRELITTPRIQLVFAGNGGFCKKELRLQREYVDIYPTELKELKTVIDTKGSGAIILHGSPGSGKSSLIAQLSKVCYDTEFLYLPAHLASALDDPNFITFLVNNNNACFILEDCEAILRKREDTNSSALSAILNLTDGLLGAGLNQKFILTFNTSISNIDEALTRSGRLKYFKEFARLNAADAKKIAEYFHKDLPEKSSYSVAEIFNGENLAGNVFEKAKCGF